MSESMTCVAVLVLREAVGATFLCAGVVKSRRFREFVDVLAAIARRAIPSAMLRGIGGLVLAAEILAGGALIVGLQTAVVSWVIVGLLLVFTGALVVLAGSGQPRQCMCFGALDAAPIGPLAYARNGVLIAGALVVAAASDTCPGSQERIWALPAWVPLLGGLTFAVATAIYGLAGVMFGTTGWK